MSNSQPAKTFEKDKDYASVFADGVILELGRNNSCKLTFYQEDIELEDNVTDLKDAKKIKTLTVQVNIPEGSLKGLLIQTVFIGMPEILINMLNPETLKKDTHIIDDLKGIYDTVTSTQFDSNTPDEETMNKLRGYLNTILARMYKGTTGV